MRRYCFTLQVRADKRGEYAERHRNVWPEMRAALRESGWHNYSLFLRDDGLLAGYVEADDLDRAQAAMAATEVNTRWSEWFEDVLVDLTDADGNLDAYQEVWHMS